jgi:hypothetical protein
VFRELKLLRTHYKVNGGATLVQRKVTLTTNAPIHATALHRQPCPPLRPPVGLILFMWLLDRTMFVERSITSQWRKPRKLHTWSLVHFFVNDTSAVVLFDSGASHSFISAAYVEKHNLPMDLLRCQMIVSSPGGDMPARQLCPKVNLKIRGVDFVTNLIVLESKGINVILGMDWLSKHKVLINCAEKYVKMTTPDGKGLEFVVKLVVTAKGVANGVKVN